MIKGQGIRFYEINSKYVEYLSKFEPHIYINKKNGNGRVRKYIGVVLNVNGLEYFAPLSSLKKKHQFIEEGLDIIKIKKYAVINLNNMFPVPESVCKPIDFSNEKNPKYKDLMQAEYRFIKKIEDKIKKNASLLYKHKFENGNSTPLSKRCNDFALLEIKCREYKNNKRKRKRRKTK